MKTREIDEDFCVIFEKEHPTIINAIRRTIIDEVPTFAIDEVEINQNDSGMYDEVIAHRLGLIPLKTNLNDYNLKSDCKCGGIGCALCEVKLNLSIDEPGMVYSSELKSDDPEIVPSNDGTPITKLIGEQKLELTSKAILGTGFDHAKWAPAHSYISEEKDKQILHIEAFGQLDAKTIYNKSIDIIQNKLKVFKEELNN